MARAHVMTVARVLLLALAYYATARLGLRYATIGESISLVWPPAGIACAGLLLWGRRVWPGVLAGAFAANATTEVPIGVALGIAGGNTLGAIAGATLFRRIARAAPDLEEVTHVRAYIIAAAPAAAMLAAVSGVLTLTLGGELSRAAIPGALASWWVGDFVGLLVAGPVLLAWAGHPRVVGAERRILEALVLCIGTVAVGQVALGRYMDAAGRQIHWEYLLFPCVIWAALRFGPRGASLTTLAVAAIGVWSTARGGGPFIATTDAGTIVAVTTYVGVVAVTGLLLAAAVAWERTEATATLRGAEDRLRLALDAARLGIWHWSVESNTLTWDDNLRAIYGLPEGQSVTTYEEFLSLVHPDDRLRVADSVARARRDGASLDYEFRIVHPDGAVRWVADQGRVVRDATDAVIRMTGVCLDVTERHLADERLRAAHRMDSVGRLAGGVAHETNNQMSVVLGAAHFLLRRQDLDESARADLEHISQAADRTAQITAQLLAFSRRQLLRPVSLDLSDAVGRWESVLRRVAGENCEVRLRLATGMGRVRADLGQLHQVLLNLVLNARDAMADGGTITIETFETELGAEAPDRHRSTAIRPGSYGVIAVSDTGIGMSPSVLERIFEPFFTTKPVGAGTGLGLATVYGIVKQSDGYIWAYSEPGLGSTFKVYLPLETGHVTAEHPAAGPPRGGHGELIVVVEDDAMVRAMTRRALEGAGYRVIEVSSGDGGVEAVRRAGAGVGAVLSDLVMPGLTAHALAGRIEEVSPGTPVLFTSGYTDGEIERRGLLPPGAPFLQKPSSPDGIVAFVGRHVRVRARA